MRVIALRQLLSAMFSEGPELPPTIDSIEFLQRHHSEVYRVRAGGRTFIVHATPESSEYLQRVRDNLRRLEVLREDRLPRVLAWRHGDDGVHAWAVMVCSYVVGQELSPGSHNRGAWLDLCRVLFKVHSLPADRDRKAPALRFNDPEGFLDFVEMLKLRLAGLPLNLARVERHTASMAAYLDEHRHSFAILPRLIHGDLNRANFVVEPSKAGIIDWSELGAGDYAYDIALLKFIMDSVAPTASTALLRQQARGYRDSFRDASLEERLRFHLALAGLVHAFWYAGQSSIFKAARAWRVRTCYLHSEAQWQAPLRLDGDRPGAPATRTEHWALKIRPPLRGLYYMLAPKRVA